MKRILAILFSMAILISLFIPSVVLAVDPPTVVSITWNGGGTVTGSTTVKNDAVSSFGVSAGYSNGAYTCTGYNDNPYTYGVDSTSSIFNAHVENGASFFQVDRTDAKTSMYGHAGQTSYSYVEAYGGFAEMAMASQTNYASMRDNTYGAYPKTASGKNYEANAASFVLNKWVGTGGTPLSPTDNWASFAAVGSGIALIDTMCSESQGGVKLGYGCGCYTNADASFNGAGQFSVNAVGSNLVRTPSSTSAWNLPGNGTFGSVGFTATAIYNGSWSLLDYSVEVQ